MRYIDKNLITEQIVFALLLQVVVGGIQIAIAICSYLHAVLVAHGWVPK